MVFSDYAHFYDLYYAEKDYAREVDFVLELASRFGAIPSNVLDMGCGTGRHMEEFIKRDIKCDGFDISPEMLTHARQRLVGKDVMIEEGDITSFENGKKYDLVIAMFAVMGYLIENEQLLSGLRTALKHMRPNGLFIFDGWFGPAVLDQKPEERCHEYDDEKGRVERKVVPRLDPVKQTVTINYEVNLIRDGETVKKISEEHIMRFMFIQEMAIAMENAGLELIYYCPFMAPDREITTADWNIAFVARGK